MSEPIRAALLTAWEKSPSFLVTLPSGNRRTSLSVLETAQMIAAFLRGLDDGAVLTLMKAEQDPHRGWRDTLVEAVLAAGEEK
jgi:hypothetical protein